MSRDEPLHVQLVIQFTRTLASCRFGPTTRFWGSQDGLVVINHPFHLCHPGSTLGPEIVCGLSVNLTPRVFLRVLRFSSLSKIDSQPIPSGCGAVLRRHTWVVFRGRAPSRQHSSFDPTSLSRDLSNLVYDCE